MEDSSSSRQSLMNSYGSRLNVDYQSLKPNKETLSLLIERHLKYIPFENLSLHLISSSANEEESRVVLTRAELIQKILAERRGGCCLELNGLFAILLKEIGFSSVHLVPCWVYAGPERGHSSRKAKFRVKQSHFILLVLTNEDKLWIVDVGLGEPPCHPLEYRLDELQETPEGMISRIRWDPRGSWIDGSTGQARKCLILEWWQTKRTETEGYWEPRLQWDVLDAPLDAKSLATLPERSLESFRHVIDILLHPRSTFARKLIVCRLARGEKLSLAGRVLKRTSPRFGKDSKVCCRKLKSDNEVRTVLEEEFGIPLSETTMIDWKTSDASSNRQLWDHL